jgi:molybdopterin synthase catalytic subunit
MAPQSVVRGRRLSEDGALIIGPVVERHAGEHTGGLSRPDRGLRRDLLHGPTMTAMGLSPPERADDWVGLSAEPLPLDAARAWAEQPSCGAVVLFTGTVRDHADGRRGVSTLQYEAYEEEVESRLAAIAAEARRRVPAVGRLVLLHRVGVLEVGEASVAVVASAPHRGEAFDAARFAIDTLKATVPIWKRETWADGDGWGLTARPIEDVRSP